MTSQVSLLLILQRFQLTRSRGAWPISVFWIAKYRYFNSHAHVERDACSFQQNYCVLNFNSHAHVERDIGFLWGYDRWDHFNSHAHVERDTFPFTIAGETLNFNSHAHVERDLGGNSTNSFRGISTHTLTWSVTNRFVHIISRKGISTHTLTWSVTCDSSSVCRYRLFQLTRSRGAWLIPVVSWKLMKLFQLTRSRGAWQISGTSTNVVFLFQLTRSRGAWRIEAKKEQLLVDFNSHAHVERDSSTFIVGLLCLISTHTLTWSVTMLMTI